MRTSGATVVFSGVTVIVARRPVPDRLDRDALAGDRRDHRRRDLDHRRRHAAAGADRAARAGASTSRGKIVVRHRRATAASGPSAKPAGHADFWERWTSRGDEALRAVGRSLAAGVLLALAIPALSLDFGNGALRQFPDGHETRVGSELAGEQVAGRRVRAAADRRRRRRADHRPAQDRARGVRRPAEGDARRRPRRGPDRLRRRQGRADQGRRRARTRRADVDARAARAPARRGRPGVRRGRLGDVAGRRLLRPAGATSPTSSPAASGRSSCS